MAAIAELLSVRILVCARYVQCVDGANRILADDSGRLGLQAQRKAHASKLGFGPAVVKSGDGPGHGLLPRFGRVHGRFTLDRRALRPKCHWDFCDLRLWATTNVY